MTTTNKKLFRLKQTNFFTRWECHICGGATEKVSTLCEADDGMRICESCLKTRDFDEQLESRAMRLMEMAEVLRGLIGKIDAPPFEAYQKAEEEYERRWEKENPDAKKWLEAIEAQASTEGIPF